MKPLPWVYCECGCHTLDLDVGGMRFSQFMPHPGSIDPDVHVHEGSHLMGAKLGTFKGHEGVEKFMRAELKRRARLALKILGVR